jgi:hypothetical protein
MFTTARGISAGSWQMAWYRCVFAVGFVLAEGSVQVCVFCWLVFTLADGMVQVCVGVEVRVQRVWAAQCALKAVGNGMLLLPHINGWLSVMNY